MAEVQITRHRNLYAYNFSHVCFFLAWAPFLKVPHGEGARVSGPWLGSLWLAEASRASLEAKKYTAEVETLQHVLFSFDRFEPATSEPRVSSLLTISAWRGDVWVVESGCRPPYFFSSTFA